MNAMRVLIMRHGAAAPASHGPDGHRFLTPTGRLEVEATATALLGGAWHPTHIYTSPLVRAVQTAERVASVLEHDDAVVTEAGLVPGGSATQAFGVLSQHGAGDVLLFVSHEPTVRALVGHLLGQGVRAFTTGEARGLVLGETVSLEATFGD